MRAGGHLMIHPPVDQLLQACLPAQVLDRSIVGGHVLPRIYLQHLPLGSVLMRTVRFRPGQPPVVHGAFLFSADIAIAGLGPGHFTNSSQEVAGHQER